VHCADHAAQFSSTAQDLARGKRGEIDHLNGYVLRRGAELGLATPVNRVLHCVVRLLESRAEKYCALQQLSLDKALMGLYDSCHGALQHSPAKRASGRTRHIPTH
jgi:hypothetical protein